MDNNRKSRTQQKNEDRALQMLGQELVDLSSQQLQNIKIPDEILEAVRFARKITRHGARRRQIQRIRALLREVDVESIQNALKTIKHGYNRQTLAFKNRGNSQHLPGCGTAAPDAARTKRKQGISIRKGRKIFEDTFSLSEPDFRSFVFFENR
ncbi:MAG: DUF615 domain-containing protein [Deltaproteobacteria bacterium]|nr:DUF615 domain-containing protein [Deltaproteobacteria bacterium]